MKRQASIILRNARVFDGSGSPSRVGDVLIRGQKIEAVGASLQAPEGTRELNLDGRSVSPGWIDLHTHVFAGYGVFSVAPEDIGLRSGVTTLVDAGSTGALNYEIFEKNVIRGAREKILAYVNIASTGLPHGHAGISGFVGDHMHPGLHSPELAQSLLEHFSNSIVGWKARLTAVLADNDASLERQALDRLLTLRDATGLPVMVHHIESSIPAEILLDHLKAGDVYTHLYHGRESTIFDPQTGEPLPSAVAARERGVLFDVGHGSGAFQWECAKKACQDHRFWPDTISSDLHHFNLFQPVRDMATTMTKFLHLGLPLERVIAMVTGNAAAALGSAAGSGLLRVGDPADLTVFEMVPGPFPLPDAAGVLQDVPERILPLVAFSNGEAVSCHGFFQRAATDNALAEGLQAVTGA